jgi:hypothetical protein
MGEYLHEHDPHPRMKTWCNWKRLNRNGLNHQTEVEPSNLSAEEAVHGFEEVVRNVDDESVPMRAAVVFPAGPARLAIAAIFTALKWP